uniref:F-box domain-containing protein n=1 Tax=Nyssomyia neivai TaxID=330878 RepID=A0A1L8DBA1_9DIPT
MECSSGENIVEIIPDDEEVSETTIFDIPVQDIMVDRLAKYLRWEDLVNLRNCSRGARELADCMFNGLTKIQIIHYTGCVKCPFDVILQYCRKLRKIYLSNLAWLTDDLLVELLCRNPHLEFFHISLCTNITATGMIPLATHSKKLQFLFVPHMNFGDEFLNVFNQHNNQLQRIDLAWNERLTGQCLEKFFQNQPNLKKIRLTYVKADVSMSLVTIAKVCRKLYYMDISHCMVEVDDRVILDIAENCPDLRTMFLNMSVHRETKEYLKNRGIDTGGLCCCVRNNEHRMRRRWEAEELYIHLRRRRQERLGRQGNQERGQQVEGAPQRE